MKEIVTKTTGDPYAAVEFNEGVSFETQNLVERTDQVFDSGNSFQLGQAVTRIAESATRFVDSGLVNAYVLTQESDYAEFYTTAYTKGQTVQFSALNTNTGASTIKINSVGGAPIQILDSSTGLPLVGGEIVADVLTTLYFDGTDFIDTNINVTGVVRLDDLADQTLGQEGAKLVGVNVNTQGRTLQEHLDSTSVTGALRNEVSDPNAGANNLGCFVDATGYTVQEYLNSTATSKALRNSSSLTDSGANNIGVNINTLQTNLVATPLTMQNYAQLEVPNYVYVAYGLFTFNAGNPENYDLIRGLNLDAVLPLTYVSQGIVTINLKAGFSLTDVVVSSIVPRTIDNFYAFGNELINNRTASTIDLVFTKNEKDERDVLGFYFELKYIGWAPLP